MSALLKSKTASATKAITVRIPTELDEKIKLLRRKADAKGMRIDLSSTIAEQLDRLVDKSLKELDDV